MILVTGAAGFVGSAVVRLLNTRGHRDLLVVDDLTDGDRFVNLVGTDFRDYLDRGAMESMIDRGDPRLDTVDAVIHQGACTDTTVRDGRRMLRDNYEASRRLADFCLRRRVPMVYASSAAVYGTSSACTEEPSHERPLNVYAWSKLLFDQWARREVFPTGAFPLAGLRYFNVYGPGEAHKGPMASMAYQLDRQARTERRVRLFGAGEGAPAGGHQRDFVHVDDVAAVVCWFLDHPTVSGIYNVGTGTARSFGDLATLVLDHHGLPGSSLEYVPFPESLRGRYQSHTRADLTRLRACGCTVPFRPLEVGVPDYLARLGPPVARTDTRHAP